MRAERITQTLRHAPIVRGKRIILQLLGDLGLRSAVFVGEFIIHDIIFVTPHKVRRGTAKPEEQTVYAIVSEAGEFLPIEIRSRIVRGIDIIANAEFEPMFFFVQTLLLRVVRIGGGCGGSILCRFHAELVQDIDNLLPQLNAVSGCFCRVGGGCIGGRGRYAAAQKRIIARYRIEFLI
jgi:hypothetical protein